MTQVKLDSKITKAVEKALEPYAAEIFHRLGGHWIGIVEFESVERTETADDEEKAPAAKLRAVRLEIATDEHHKRTLREAQRALYKLRTKDDTLDEHLMGESASQTVQNGLRQIIADALVVETEEQRA